VVPRAKKGQVERGRKGREIKKKVDKPLIPLNGVANRFPNELSGDQEKTKTEKKRVVTKRPIKE